MRCTFLIRLRHRMILSSSINRQMPLLIQTFWYLVMASVQSLSLAQWSDSESCTYSGKCSSGLLGLGTKVLPRNILQGMRYFKTSLFCPTVRMLILSKYFSAASNFWQMRAALPFWKLQLSTKAGPCSPQALGLSMMRMIWSQLWYRNRIDTCRLSIRGRICLFTQSIRLRFALNSCSLMMTVSFLMASPPPDSLSCLDAARNILLVLRMTCRRGQHSHSIDSSLISSMILSTCEMTSKCSLNAKCTPFFSFSTWYCLMVSSIFPNSTPALPPPQRSELRLSFHRSAFTLQAGSVQISRRSWASRGPSRRQQADSS